MVVVTKAWDIRDSNSWKNNSSCIQQEKKAEWGLPPFFPTWTTNILLFCAASQKKPNKPDILLKVSIWTELHILWKLQWSIVFLTPVLKNFWELEGCHVANAVFRGFSSDYGLQAKQSEDSFISKGMSQFHFVWKKLNLEISKYPVEWDCCFLPSSGYTQRCYWKLKGLG